MIWRLHGRRFHVSWVIAMVALGIVLGVVAARYADITLGWLPWVFVAAGCIALACWRPVALMFAVAFGGGIILGIIRGSIATTALAPYTSLHNTTAVIRGSVSEDPDVSAQGSLQLRVAILRVNGSSAEGKAWVDVPRDTPIKRGDILTIRGTINEGFGTFVVSMYRAEVQQIERPYPGDAAGRVRDWFAEHTRTVIDEPQASLGIGYLVGQRRALPEELDEALRITGLTHVVVASGYNLTILVRLARRLFERISKYLSVTVSGGMIIAFIGVTGLSPSMSRAGLVTGLSLLAWYYGRSFHPIILLLLVSALTVLFDPSYAWGDLGWLLSFVAFAGVMIVAPLAQRYFFGETEPGTIRQIIGETTAAHIMTLPIIALAFSEISNVAIVANALVLPFVPLAMLLTFVAGIVAIFVPHAAAEIIAMPAQWLLLYMTETAQWLAGQSWATNELSLGIIGVMLWYGIVVVLCIVTQRTTQLSLQSRNIVT